MRERNTLRLTQETLRLLNPLPTAPRPTFRPEPCSATCYLGNLSSTCASGLSEGLAWIVHSEPDDVNLGYAEYTRAPIVAQGVTADFVDLDTITAGASLPLQNRVFSVELFGYIIPPVTGTYSIGQMSGTRELPLPMPILDSAHTRPPRPRPRGPSNSSPSPPPPRNLQTTAQSCGSATRP